ncbi:MAG: hypothetical protein U0625_03530 [Phycisphaerales bacterium]
MTQAQTHLSQTQARQEPTKEEQGMAFTPDVVLFIGAVVLTAALTVALVPFFRRILREDAAARGGRDGGGA